MLSRDDTLRRLQERVDDYRSFGIAHISVLDPVKRGAYVCTSGDFREPENKQLTVTRSAIRIPLAELFAELD